MDMLTVEMFVVICVFVRFIHIVCSQIENWVKESIFEKSMFSQKNKIHFII